MAEDTGSWTDFLLGLPPQLQGIAVLGAGGVVAYLVWKKYLKQARGEGPQSTDFAQVVGSPAALYDMGPIKELVEQTGLLVQQMVRNNIATERCADALSKTCKLYEDQLERAETNEQLEEARQEGFNQGRASRTRRTARRAPTKAKPQSS